LRTRLIAALEALLEQPPA